MIARRAWAALLLLTAAVTIATARTSELSDAALEGRNLARQLCELRPADSFTNVCTLSIGPAKGRKREFPLRTVTTLTETNWVTVYEILPNTNSPDCQRLIVTHNGTQPNGYTLSYLQSNGVLGVTLGTNGTTISQPGNPDGGSALPASEEKDFPGRALTMSPFAGSDFWLADLGLEFLHWPGQNLLKKELRSGQSCYVLESLNPRPITNGYARVVSWIDIDSVQQSDQPGLIHADAYDAKGKLLKEFEWKEVEKVNGRWQVSEVQMRNLQTGSRTTLKFKFGQR